MSSTFTAIQLNLLGLGPAMGTHQLSRRVEFLALSKTTSPSCCVDAMAVTDDDDQRAIHQR